MQDPPVDPRDLREQNRLSWNAVVGAHDSHRGDLPAFLRKGGSTLFPEELGLLGDLEGRPSSTSSATRGAIRSAWPRSARG